MTKKFKTLFKILHANKHKPKIKKNKNNKNKY